MPLLCPYDRSNIKSLLSEFVPDVERQSNTVELGQGAGSTFKSLNCYELCVSRAVFNRLGK